MKTTCTIIITVLLAINGFLPQQAGAQSPEKISYQAIVRDGSNELVSSSSIRMRISILQGSISGTAVYVETQTPAANANGLVSLEIGNGTVVSGDFATIDWSVGLYFIKTETDPIGGTSYTITGTSQLLSVPYALYAKTSGSATGPAGADGISAYQLWLNLGNSGTEADFIASLAGSGSTQDIALTGTELSISDGSTIDLSVIDTDTKLTETEVDAFTANNGYIATETQDLTLAGTDLSITGGSTIDLSTLTDFTDTNTQLSEAEVDAFVANNGYSPGAHTVDTDTHLDAAGVNALGFTSGAHTVDTDTHLDEMAVDAFVANNGYLTAEVDGDATNEFQDISTDNTAGNLSLSDGSTIMLNVNDADADATNELQDISGIATNAAAISKKAPIESPTFIGTVSGIDKSMVGLGNVDNTSDADKLVSTATQSILDLKVDKEAGKSLSTNDYTKVEQKKLAAITGTNTGDQDLSGLATILSVTKGLATKVDKELGKGLSPNGTSPGQMQYWDGSAWVGVPAGLPGQFLQFTPANIPAWSGPVYATLSTTIISSITSSAVSSGGSISNDGGATITARGVCWSTLTNPTTANSKTIDGSGAGTFTSSITGLTVSITYYLRAYATNSAGTAYGNEISFVPTVLSIGDNYQGGIVTYILQLGDPGYDASVLHGLIAAPSDQTTSQSSDAGTTNYIATGAVATALGTGNANTNTIVTIQGDGSYAAKLCADLVLGGYSDWYLPSQDELNKLYINKTVVGGFASGDYWSSTELSSDGAWIQNFDNGNFGFVGKWRTLNVRAIRDF